MTERRQPACDRTRRLIDRVVEDRVTADDRAHAETCASCGPVMLKAARFDDALRRSAQGLVTERLPYGVLDPELAPARIGGVLPTPHAASGLASIFAAVVVLMIATAVAVAPGGLTGGTEPPDSGFTVQIPTFRSSFELVPSLQKRDYLCTSGHALPTSGPSARLGEREGGHCLTPKSIERASATIIAVENGDGDVVEVTIAGKLYGTGTVSSRAELAAVMGKLTTLSIGDPAVAVEAGTFVERTLPRLKVLASGDVARHIVGDVQIVLERYIAGDYFLVLTRV
jgi:hypothetical protein